MFATGGYYAGHRENGSSDGWYRKVYRSLWGVCGLDSSGIWEGKSNNTTGITFYNYGFIDTSLIYDVGIQDDVGLNESIDINVPELQDDVQMDDTITALNTTCRITDDVQMDDILSDLVGTLYEVSITDDIQLNDTPDSSLDTLTVLNDFAMDMGDTISGDVWHTGQANFTLPSLSLTAKGYTGEKGIFDKSLPLFQISGTGISGNLGQANIELPLLLTTTTGKTGEVGTASFTLPVITLTASSILTTTDITLPLLSINATGLTGHVGTFNTKLSVIQLTAVGLQQGTGVANIILPKLIIRAVGAYGGIGTTNVNLPIIRITSNGLSGQAGTAAFTLPSFLITATGGGAYTGIGDIVLPMFVIDAYGQSDVLGDIAGGTYTIQVYVMNTKTFAVTSYSGLFNFNSYCKFNGVNLGANSNGIFSLSGNNDNGTNIDSDVRKNSMDFGISNLKRPTDAYLAVRTDGKDYIFQIVTDDLSQEYIINDNRTGLHTKKLDTGKGLKGRYISWKLKNKNGGELDINEIELIIEQLKRRAR